MRGREQVAVAGQEGSFGVAAEQLCELQKTGIPLSCHGYMTLPAYGLGLPAAHCRENSFVWP